MLGSALAPDFVTEGRSLIFSGKPGRGKTHLAIAIAYRAIQNGFDAFFTTAATLIDDLSAAFRAGQLAEALQAYTHPSVLVVDEVGYLTYGTDAANMLFHVVNERHRRHRSMIFTTNKALKAWGRVLHDEDLGQAIIDRVLERGRLIRLDGPSIRTLHLKLDEALKDESDQDDEVARISGNKWPEFPEPTHGNFSPDGRLVAYTSSESGGSEVHVQTFPLTDRQWTVSTTGGYQPRWRADGREMSYLSTDQKLMAVAVGPGPTFGKPMELFAVRIAGGGSTSWFRTRYVPGRDGKRFLINTPAGEAPMVPITVVLNWTAGLK